MNKMKLNIQIFASGTISGTSTSSGGACRIVWSSTKNDTNNTSSVTATVQARRTTAGSTYCTLAGTVTIDGTNKSISKYRPSSDPWNSDWKDVGSFTKVVTHNSDGSKQINISCNVNGDAGSMEGNFKASATVTLDKINRTSLLGEIDDFNIDDTVSISITKYITTATDTLVIKAGDTTIKTISSISNGYNLTFTTAEKNVIKEKMTSPRIILTFTLTSIDGTTTLGTSVKSAICIFLDMPTIFRIKKNTNGNYRLAINGPCDANGGVLQIYDDEGNLIFPQTDTGWINLGYVSGYTAGTAGQLRYRKIGNIVYIQGGATGTFTIGSYVQVNHQNSLLPHDCRPSQIVRCGCGGTGGRAGLVEIGVDGVIKFAHQLSSAPAWLGGSISYPVD